MPADRHGGAIVSRIPQKEDEAAQARRHLLQQHSPCLGLDIGQARDCLDSYADVTSHDQRIEGTPIARIVRYGDSVRQIQPGPIRFRKRSSKRT
jgi:hypothetical protein